MSKREINDEELYREEDLSSFESNEKAEGFDKRIVLTVLIVVTVLCVIFGSIIHVFMALRNARKNTFVAGGPRVSYEQTLAEFSSIEVDVNAIDISIKVGDEYSFVFDGDSRLEPTVTVEGGKLKITQKIKDFKPNFSSYSSKTEITIPANAMDKLSFDVDAGNIELYEGEFNEIDFDVDAGNIEFHRIKGDKVSIDADAGNIELKDCEFTSYAELGADMGNIEVSNSSIARMDVDVDMGNIDLEGNFEEINANCSLGEISVTTENEAAKLKLETDLGNVTVNGQDMGKRYNN